MSRTLCSLVSLSALHVDGWRQMRPINISVSLCPKGGKGGSCSCEKRDALETNLMSGHNKFSKIKHKKAATDAKKSKVFSMHARKIATAVKDANGDPTSPTVRAAVLRARSDSMPNENIERAIKKGAGGEAGDYRPVLFEGFGPGGVAVLIEGLTDNNNRTSQEVRHVFTKAGLSLGAPGSAKWAFQKGADGWEALTKIELEEEDIEKLAYLIEELEDHDDVSAVWTSAA